MISRNGRSPPPSNAVGVKQLLCKITGLSEAELEEGRLAAIAIFCLLAGYYVMKPLREEIGLLIGKEYAPRLFMGTMVAMLLANPLFSALMARFERLTFIKIIYRFFAANILIFIGVFKYLEATGQMPEGGQATNVSGVAFWTAIIFFIWVSVYNLFAVSVFWALMADIYDSKQSKKVFGFLGAGGTFGGLIGSLLTKEAVGTVGPTNLLLLTLILLEAAVWLLKSVAKDHREPERKPGEKSPNALSGVSALLKSPYLLTICLYIFFYAFTSSFLYFEQQHIVDAALENREARVDYYATVNTIFNAATLVIQLFLTGRLLPMFGLSVGLSLVPVVTVVGFLALAYEPSLTVLAGVDILRRTANYGITRPAREVLFTVVGREEKYLSKSFIDTFVYRGGDSVASASFEVIQAQTTSLKVISLIAVGVGVIYTVVAWFLGLAQVKKAKAQESSEAGSA